MEIVGRYCKDCKIFAETIEPEALQTVYGICEHPAFDGAKIRIMPDMHQGKGIVIGFTCPVGSLVNPEHIGVDIGCQMTCLELSSRIPESKYPMIERNLRKLIPTGFEIHSSRVYETKELYRFLTKEYRKARSCWPEMIPEVGEISEDYITKLLRRIGMDEGIFYKSIGSIGGGNHYEEYGETEDGRGFFTVHCGSRNFGVKVANYWILRAKKTDFSGELKLKIEEIKRTESDKRKWDSLIKNASNKLREGKPNGYLLGQDLQGYLSDMVIAQAYAHFNHEVICRLALDVFGKLGIKEKSRINTIHNYISFDDRIIRKGAIKSYIGEKIIIPFNMRDGVAVCEGKSNEDWNFSAPHGAGRLMSRSAARNTIGVQEFKDSMVGIYSTCIGLGTLDESPMVYKDKDEILRLISPTAEVLYLIQPKINIKATETSED